MRIRDFAASGLLTIRQQKGRTTLSLVGVIIGALLLLFSLAARRGVQDAVSRVFGMEDALRQISVSQKWDFDESDIPTTELQVAGDVDDAMRARIRAMLVRRWRMENSRGPVTLTGERIEQIAALPHVRGVYPETSLHVSLVRGDHELMGFGTSVPLDDKNLSERVLAGKAFASDTERTILLNEFVAWRWGYDSVERMRALIGTRVRLENRSAEQAVASSLSLLGAGAKLERDEIVALNSALERLPAIIDGLPLSDAERAAMRKVFPRPSVEHVAAAPPQEKIIAEEFIVAGIFRGPTDAETKHEMRLGFNDPMPEFLLPVKTATAFALRFPYHKEQGFYQATVQVDDASRLRPVSDRIREMGFHQYSLVDFVEFIQKQVRQVTLLVSLVALLALLISAVGIANTMVMSVTARTREIGIMKALGARDGQIQMLFLMEGLLIGLLGGGAALLIGLLIRIPIESLIVAILESEMHKKFDGQQVIQFPLWLPAAVLAFCTVVTTLATILPASKAARIDPIAALRHD